MPDDPTDRDYIGECALHQDREGVSINVYEGLSDEDRIALARMTTDSRPNGESSGWIAAHPPEEL
jgi:hypothetical protein